MSNADIGQECANIAEQLEGDKRLAEFIDPDDNRNRENLIEVLEHRYTVSDTGTVTEVEALVAFGGPTIRVECLSGVVAGSWGFDSHRCHVESDRVVQYGRRLADRMERRID